MDDIYLQFKQEQHRLNKEHISFTINKQKDDPQIYTDTIRLKQILSNLLNNAFKFTDKGFIKVGYEAIKINKIPYFRFFVSDSGIGIPEEKSSIIFKRFGQIKTQNNKTYQGTGLGLSICKGLAKLLGGEIGFESTQNETTFYFTVPDKYDSFVNNKKSIINDKKTILQKWDNIKILVVEDNTDNLEFLRTLLEKNGAIVLSARTGEEAVEIIKQDETIQIVLMDIQLPQMNGLETTQIIKAINPDIPVIAQTAYALYDDCDICLKNGCDDYVPKPLKKDVLFEKINHYIYK
ncbi:MAG: response regulator [Bacteroidota bacterium]|nr:response regulator [Bacteroidota bacterium]